MTDNLCPTCSSAACTPYWEKAHRSDDTEDSPLWRGNRAEGQFWICLWLSLTNLQATSSWVVLAAWGSEKIYLDGWQILHRSSRLPVSPQRAHVTALKAKLLDNDIVGLFLCIHFIFKHFYNVFFFVVVIFLPLFKYTSKVAATVLLNNYWFESYRILVETTTSQ